jgi:glutamate transport system permease protein
MSADATVLYDAPGPRARVRNRVIAVLGGLLLAGGLYVVARALAAEDQLTGEKWSPFLDPESWTAYIIPGLVGTLVAAAISVVLAIIVGILLGMGRLSEVAPIRIASGAFVEFFRAVPVLVMMLFAYFFGIFVVQVDPEFLPLFGTVVGLTFYNSCVIAELVRSGVHSLPRGQREAGWAIGLTPTQTLTSILLPQAITAMLPSIISQLVVILKDSALGYNIVYLELLRQGQNLATYRGNLIPTLIVLAAIYIIINFGLTKVASLVERRLREGKRGIKAGPEAGFVVMEETEADEGVPEPVQPRQP